MKISCIMSNFNTPPDYLEKAIESVLNQTFSDFELIIVDDGSNDDSVSVLKSFESKDKRIKLLYNGKNRGLAYSLNYAIEVAEGEYIARMDTDDYSLPNRFERQIMYMEQNPDIDIIGTYALCFGSLKGFGYTPYTDKDYCRSALLCYDCLIHPTVMMRKSFLEKNNLKYDTAFTCSQDFDLWTRCLEYGDIAILPEVLFLYRYHSSQLTSSKKVIQRECSKRICLKELTGFLNASEEEINCHLVLNGNESIELQAIKNYINWIYKLLNALNDDYSKSKTKTLLFSRLYVLLMNSNNATKEKIKVCLKYKELRSVKIMLFQIRWIYENKVRLPIKCRKFLSYVYD